MFSRLLPSFAISLVFISPAVAADLIDGWNFLSPGVPPTSAIFGKVNVPLAFTNVKAGGVVDTSTTPANPFPNTPRAFYMDSTDGGTARLRTRPFVDRIPAKGFYEITFRIQEGGFYFNMGTIPVAWSPMEPTAYNDTTQLIAFRMISGQPIMLKKATYKTEEVPVLDPEVNYTFKVEWEAPEGADATFRFFLNDKPLLTSDNTPVSLPIAQSELMDSIGFSIFSTSSRIFIGSINAKPAFAQ